MTYAVPQMAPPAADAAAAGAVRRGPDRRWALAAVLVVQAGLSARLAWTDTADQDEARCLEWVHWAGSLAGARLLALALMLGVTALLWATATRLYGLRAALLACGLFATLAGTQLLGSMATFDPAALFLLALATWLGVRAGTGHWSPVLLAGAGLALAAADLTRYATVLLTPVVIVVAALAAGRRPGRAAPAIVLAGWVAGVGAAAAAGGRDYWLAMASALLARPAAAASAAAILKDAYVWTSLVLVLSVLGVWLSARRRDRDRTPGWPLTAVLLAAALLAPAAQAWRHNPASLAENVTFGAWFAAIAAGCALARLSRVDRGYGWAAVMALPIAAATLFGSMGQAHTLHRAWPDTTALVRVLRPAVHAHPGRYLAEDDDVAAWYLGSGVRRADWSGTSWFRYGRRPAGAPSYAAAISRHHFALIVLDFGDTAAADGQITADLRRTGGYHVLAQAGRFTIWADGGGGHAGH